jgi:hypothetical protein
MRRILLALAALLAAPTAVPAQEVVRLEVGETLPGVGSERPICDAPSVAVITGGVLRAVGVGETVCSASSLLNPGVRRIYRVVVTAPQKKAGAQGKEGGGPAR